MPVGGFVPLNLKAVAGIRIGTASAGISQTQRDDLTVFELAKKTQVASVFTTNKFCAAPVTLAKKHITESSPRYLLINSGNANAGLGDVGLLSATQCCEVLADKVNVDVNQILPFSTGVIGEHLPVDVLVGGLPSAIDNLAEDNWLSAAKAIMTTDTCEKGCAKVIQLNGVDVTITGIAKGSGMIRPDMATMLSYIATDMPIAGDVLQVMLKAAVDVSFNSITVDGDTSTNDAVILMATGLVNTASIDSIEDSRYADFLAALTDVCCFLAESIVRDGEGATKLVTVKVEQAASVKDAKEVGYTIAHSPLVKTALFASDPNWGRILAAVGRAKIEELNVDEISIYLNDVCIVESGQRSPEYTEEQGQSVMNQEDILIRVVLAQGLYSASVLTCDLSYDYVKINAEYRS
ncbi:MAG: bifunctional ornithine acetyltransferase/N-acetylglutamate synthase [Cycloclasticus sp. symbiont of Bathymodiolus heckerae]|nr:MAG: bifunctional ornithine acetyltransferase/N-acetylglutamate synthase [Cycloclasticus sp. symbiont of Bathymodiolus heckerae]